MKARFCGGFDASFGGPLPTINTTEKDYFWYVTNGGEIDDITYYVGSFLIWDSAIEEFKQLTPPTFYQIRGKSSEATRWADWTEVTNIPTNIVYKDANNDISVRMVRSSYPTQSMIPKGSGISFRVSSTGDDLTRFADANAVRNFLGTMNDSAKLQGKNLEEIKSETRNGLVDKSLTINGYRLDKPIKLTPSDMGLSNVANYGNTSSPMGTSTTLYATQRAAYEASAAPRLDDERKRITAISDSTPAPDAPDGIYIKLDKDARTFTMQVKEAGVLYNEA